LNVTIRKTLGLYANVRPCISYSPVIATKHPVMDVVIVRENEEDLYAGIEHHQTDQVVQCLKLITRPGTERIVHYAFEFARRNGRKKVSVFVKDNIMKLTDGMFYKVFEEIGAQYPDIKRDKWIIDIGAARLADTPEIFDVIVCPNLYGDIISDVAAQITGSVGLGASSNIGTGFSMFEAIHGSAPDIAGKDIANPSGLLLSSCLMLQHIGQPQVAITINNAWNKVIEEGYHTPDIFNEKLSKKKVGCSEFTKAVIDNLGKKPSVLPVAIDVPAGSSMASWTPTISPVKEGKKDIVGIDIFVHCNPEKWTPDAIGNKCRELVDGGNTDMELLLITNRGVKVFPNGYPETFCTDHWRLRFKAKKDLQGPLTHQHLLAALDRIHKAGFDFIKTEHLYHLDGKPAYSLAQGE
jgi:isocitrate dehydrogenase